MRKYSITVFCTLLILIIVPSAMTACSKEEDCWLNGVCSGGSCKCDVGWKGEDCSLLNLTPAPVEGAYGYSPNISSWGGVPVYENGMYHLYVTEIVNHCGLCKWGSNSHVVHAVSNTLLGPYKSVDQALQIWSHNPQIVVDHTGPSPTYLLFHIGGATGGSGVVCASNGSGEVLQQGKKIEVKAGAAGATLHTANSTSGPWTPQAPPGLGACDNPAPYVKKNGTILLVCRNPPAYTAASWKGPWSEVNIKYTGNGGQGSWEDPFIWLDARGNWKMLTHVWQGTGSKYADRVGGFAYSKDGITWVKSPIAPFDNKVVHAGGATTAYTTRERPKLYLDPKDGTTPLALFNGVGGVPGGDKDICGQDWTFTLAQPIGA